MGIKDWKKTLETHDLKIEDLVIKCTGEISLIEGFHGVLIETEERYPNYIMVGENKDKKLTLKYSYIDESPIYDNYIMISIAAFSRMMESDKTLVEKERPEGFKSNTKKDTIRKFNYDIEEFNNKYREKLLGTGVKYFNLEGGVTISNSDEGALFDLTSGKLATRNKKEVIKRIVLDIDTISELVESEGLAAKFFQEVDEAMRKLGCSNYSSERPDKRVGLVKFAEHRSVAELRFYGLV